MKKPSIYFQGRVLGRLEKGLAWLKSRSSYDYPTWTRILEKMRGNYEVKRLRHEQSKWLRGAVNEIQETTERAIENFLRSKDLRGFARDLGRPAMLTAVCAAHDLEWAREAGADQRGVEKRRGDFQKLLRWVEELDARY